MNKLTIISRKSTLAKLQAIEVSEVIKKKYPEIKITFKTKDTSGDIDLTTPLHKMPEMGVFTSDIREELLTGEQILPFTHGKIFQLILRREQKLPQPLKELTQETF